MDSLLIAGILLASIGSMSASTCYSCSYMPNMGGEPYMPNTGGEQCNDPFSQSNTSATCDHGSYCLKTTAKVNGKIMSVSRSCGQSCSEMCASLFGLEGCVYCCQGDLCNAANSVTFGLPMLVATVTAGLKLNA